MAFLKLVGLLLVALFVVNKQWLDKLNQLVDGASRRDPLVVLDHGFADAQRYCPLVLKLHVVHQSRVVVHLQDSN